MSKFKSFHQYDQDERQEHYGRYWEEVRKIVDGVVSEIQTKSITSKSKARQQLLANILCSPYADTNEPFCIDTLRYSENANEWFRQITLQSPESLQAYCAKLNHFSVVQPGVGTASNFPFVEFARMAMQADALAILENAGAYKYLRSDDNSMLEFVLATMPDPKGTIRYSSDKPNESNVGKSNVCIRCGQPLDERGYCTESPLDCLFSAHLQHCPIGWLAPDQWEPEKRASCLCKSCSRCDKPLNAEGFCTGRVDECLFAVHEQTCPRGADSPESFSDGGNCTCNRSKERNKADVG